MKREVHLESILHFCPEYRMVSGCRNDTEFCEVSFTRVPVLFQSGFRTFKIDKNRNRIKYKKTQSNGYAKEGAALFCAWIYTERVTVVCSSLVAFNKSENERLISANNYFRRFWSCDASHVTLTCHCITFTGQCLHHSLPLFYRECVVLEITLWYTRC